MTDPVGPRRTFRIYILNDHAIFVQVLGKYLKEFDDLQVVGTGIRGALAYAHIAELQPDVVVVDPGPKLPDIEPTLGQVQQAASCAAIIALTQNYDEEYPAVVRRCGCEVFIEKMAAAEELVAAIRAVRTPAMRVALNVDPSPDTTAQN